MSKKLPVKKELKPVKKTEVFSLTAHQLITFENLLLKLSHAETQASILRGEIIRYKDQLTEHGKYNLDFNQGGIGGLKCLKLMEINFV